jgi:hypothetical protein
VEDVSSQIGIMNLLRTGNFVVDTFVSLSIPSLFAWFNFIFRLFLPFFDYLLEMIWDRDDYVWKLIEYEVIEWKLIEN